MPAKYRTVKKWEEAEKLRLKGYTNADIAAKFEVTEKAVEYWFRKLREMQSEEAGTSVKSRDDMSKVVLETLERTPEGFEKFFNRYSGMTLSQVHKVWVQDALSSSRVLINCPPRHAKSEIFSVWFPIWLVCQDRDIQILLISETDAVAKKMTNKIAYQFAWNQKLIADFGVFVPTTDDQPWRPQSGQLMIAGRHREIQSGDLTIQVRGAGQQILGFEANWIIVDDPVSRQVAASETERAKLSEWFHGDVMTRMEPGSHAFVIGQRLHMYDLYGELSKEEVNYGKGERKSLAWKHLNYPAILDFKKEKTLWPEKWGWDEIMQVRQDVGADIFEAMYQQNPLPNSRRLARQEWLYGDSTHPGCVNPARTIGEEVEERGLDVVRVASLDPSPTRYAGLIVADVDKSSPKFDCEVLEIVREKMSVRDMMHHLSRVEAVYRPQYLIFEQNAAQRWLLQDSEMEALKRRVTILPHTTSSNKADPVLGVESLAVDFEFGNIRLPYADAESKAMAELLFEEARTYPQGLTDDVLMALWFIKWNVNRLVPSYSRSNTSNSLIKTPKHLTGGFSWARGKGSR